MYKEIYRTLIFESPIKVMRQLIMIAVLVRAQSISTKFKHYKIKGLKVKQIWVKMRNSDTKNYFFYFVQ